MKVSVVIPVYNAAAYLNDAVESALAEQETGEVLLIEDASTDASLDVCRRLAARYGNVRLLQHKGGSNRGAGESRNLGISSACCEFVAFLDADDLFLPNRFAVARSLLEGSPEVDGVYEAVGTIYESEELRDWWLAHRRSEVTTILDTITPTCLFEALVDGSKGHFCTDGIVVRRQVFAKTGGFDTDLRMCQDTAMWIKMAATCTLVGGSVREPVAMRRLHGENRIYRHRHIFPYYRERHWRNLTRWALQHGLPKNRVVLLREQWLLERATKYSLHEAGVSTRLSDLAIAAAALATEPRLLQHRCSPAYLAASAAGVAWAGRWVRRTLLRRF